MKSSEHFSKDELKESSTMIVPITELKILGSQIHQKYRSMPRGTSVNKGDVIAVLEAFGVVMFWADRIPDQVRQYGYYAGNLLPDTAQGSSGDLPRRIFLTLRWLQDLPEVTASQAEFIARDLKSALEDETFDQAPVTLGEMLAPYLPKLKHIAAGNF